MPRSFAEQCLARCSVDGSKYWFSCNPEGPQHWFYTDWILKARERNAYRIHFQLDDNPSLSERVKERYRSMYGGVFADRYIRGLWVKAEGLVYEVPGEAFTECEATGRDVCALSIDYGISNPFAALLWVVRDGTAYACREYYHDGREQGRRTDEEHLTALLDMTRGLFVETVVIDPSATSFIELMRRKTEWDIRKGDNAVKDGISAVSSALASGCLKFSKTCVNLRRELGLYSWDERSAKGDAVIKENDHACVIGGTLIQTENGLLPIEELAGKSGRVWTVENGAKTLRQFRDCMKTREAAQIYAVHTTRGIIRCTEDHRVMTTRGKVEASRLMIGDEVMTLDGSTAAVVRIEEQREREDVYNMTVEGTHLYADACGHLLCNCDAMRYYVQTLGKGLLNCFEDV